MVCQPLYMAPVVRSCLLYTSFSAQYGWQAVFNTFGALAIAAETYRLQGAVSLRVSQNVFGVVFALAFCEMCIRDRISMIVTIERIHLRRSSGIPNKICLGS